MLERKAEFASQNQFKKVLDPIAAPEKKKLTKPDRKVERTTHEGEEYHELGDSKFSSVLIAQRLNWENAQLANEARKENAKLAALQQAEEAREKANALDNVYKIALDPIASSKKPLKASEYKKMPEGDLLKTWVDTERKNSVLTVEEKAAREALIKEIDELAEGSDKQKEKELEKNTKGIVSWYKSGMTLTSHVTPASHIVEKLLGRLANTLGMDEGSDKSLLADQGKVGGVDPTIEVFTSPKMTRREEKAALPSMAPPSIRMG